MPALILYILKMSISLSVVFLFYFLFLRKMTFYQWNRWYLLLYSLLSFVLPFLNIYWWLDPAPVDAGLLQYLPAIGNWKPAATESSAIVSGQWDLLLQVLVVGIALMLLRLVVQYLSLLRMHRKAKLLVDGKVKLFEVSDPVVPFSFGTAVYINPSRHDEQEIREIIRHEMVRVQERHTLDVLLSELLVVFGWFNPFAWLTRAAIRQNLEFIADRQVLVNGIDRKQYQYLLLKVVGQKQFSLASHLNISALKNRIAMMNKIRTARVHLVKFAFAVPVLAVLLLAFRNQEPQPDAVRLKSLFPMIPSLVADTVPVHKNKTWNTPLNKKGYYLTVVDNQGECIVIVKDKAKKLVKAVTLTDWDADKSYESRYGEILPPPPPAAPAAPKAPGTPAPVAAPGVPAPPAPPAAPAHSDEPATSARFTLKADSISIHQSDGEPAPLVIADGQKISLAQLHQADPSSIASINVLKGNSATTKYGRDGVNGVLEVTFKPGTGIPADALYFVNGKEATRQQVNALSKEEIKDVKVFKGEAAVEKYGEKARNGVIEITTKPVVRVELWNPLKSLEQKPDDC